MPKLEGAIGDHGAVVSVAITPPTRGREVRPDDVWDFPSYAVDALIDTGSDTTLIQAGVAEALQLSPFNWHPIRGIHNDVRDCPLYNVDLRVAEQRTLVLWLQNLLVVEVAFTHVEEDIRVILGRSVLHRSVFNYDGDKRAFWLEVPPHGS